MNGRTNITSKNQNGSSTITGEVVDLPTRLNNISCTGGNGSVNLILSYLNTTYVSGVQVNYKTGGYPQNPSDGQSSQFSGALTSINISGLVNGSTYYFRIFLYRKVNNVLYYQTDITNARITGIPRSITSISTSGLSPLATGDGYTVFSNSGTFKLTAPVGTRIILGGAGMDGGVNNKNTMNPGNGGDSGYILDYTLTREINNCDCTVSIAQSYAYGSTATQSTLNITENGKTILSLTSANGRRRIVNTKYIPLGGAGGGGGMGSYLTGSNGYCENDTGSQPTNTNNERTGCGGSSSNGGGGGGGGCWATTNNMSTLYPNGYKNGGNGGNSKYGGAGGGGNTDSGAHGANGSTTYGGNAITKASNNYGSSGGSGFGGSLGGDQNWGGSGGGGSYCSGGGGAGANDNYDSLRAAKGGQGLIVFEAPVIT